MWPTLPQASVVLQYSLHTPPNPEQTLQNLLLLPHLLSSLQLNATNTSRAKKEVPAAASISLEAPALLGDAAPSSPQPAVMTITVAAHMNIPSVTLRQELAEW